MEYIVLFVLAVFVILWGTSIYMVKTKGLPSSTWHSRSFGLPRGSVRAIFAFVILFVLTYCILTGKPIPDLPDWLVGILGTIIGFYFGAAIANPEKVEETKKAVETTNT